MSANQRMVQLLFTLAIQTTRPLAPRLADLLQADLVLEDGCWFLQPLRDGAQTATLAAFPDRTGFECFVNHVHIGDFVEEQDDVNELHRQGLLWAGLLVEKLKPHGSFNIIVSCVELDCSVRFHRTRAKERWLVEDLDTYREEALLVLVVNDD